MEEKHGTMEEFLEDAKTCGFRPDESVAKDAGVDLDKGEADATAEISLETLMACTRNDVDNCLQKILERSRLPLFLFDYVVMSVVADIRKADMDTLRINAVNDRSNQPTADRQGGE